MVLVRVSSRPKSAHRRYCNLWGDLPKSRRQTTAGPSAVSFTNPLPQPIEFRQYAFGVPPRQPLLHDDRPGFPAGRHQRLQP